VWGKPLRNKSNVSRACRENELRQGLLFLA